MKKKDTYISMSPEAGMEITKALEFILHVIEAFNDGQCHIALLMVTDDGKKNGVIADQNGDIKRFQPAIDRMLNEPHCALLSPTDYEEVNAVH